MATTLVTECPVHTEATLPPVLLSPAVSPTISASSASSGGFISLATSEPTDVESKHDAEQESPSAAATLVDGGETSATAPPAQASSGQRNLVYPLLHFWMIASWAFFMA
ncbi:hypothetical protein NLG97_g6050 [Lecanicillium saksenae]|uniref:Uncharacterized protein n=1 Tax=Lecanicillium saksenae TaxID=468837 RepID=A0ACC1QSL5_9HYPO|nr:hypothetical protein NLG97_g6050 [Lecanicillium saksenae]